MNSRRLFVLVALLAVAAIPCQAGVIYQEEFDGSSADPLNGKAPTVDNSGNTVTWLASAVSHADGTNDSSNSAWLPYSFGSSVYEVAYERTGGHSSQFAAITFDTIASPPTTYFSTSSYATLTVRANGDGDFWAGARNANGVDTDNFGDGSDGSGDGTLRLVLDTTGANWTVDGYFTPTGGSETVLDLDPGSAGTQYVYGTNPPTLTAVGITMSASVPSGQFTFSEVPEPATLSLIGLGALMMVRRR